MNDRIAERIRKCLELANSSNKNEAANAMRMAQKLLQKYNLTEEKVLISEILSKQVLNVKIQSYTQHLIYTVARAFGVKPLLVSHRMNSGVVC